MVERLSEPWLIIANITASHSLVWFHWLHDLPKAGPLALKTTHLERWIWFVGSDVVCCIGIDDFKLNGRVTLPVLARRWADCSVATSYVDQPCSNVESCYRPFEDSQ